MSRSAVRWQVIPRALWRLLGKPWRRRPADDKVGRILIAHHLLLGDTLMLTPLLAALRQRYPQAEIVMLCPKAVAPLYAGRPYGVSVLPWHPADGDSLVPLWQRRGFDLAFVPGDNRYSWLALAAGARWIVAHGQDRPGWKNWPLDEAHDYSPTPDSWHGMVAALADSAFDGRFDPADWPLPSLAENLRPTLATPYALLHVGASTPLKHWPNERWLALADWLAGQGIQPYWSGGPGEEKLVAALDPAGRYPSLAGKLNLLQLAHVMQSASLLVCPDTGVAHLARIVACPTLTLFGPGSYELCGAGRFWQSQPFIALQQPVSCRDQRVMFRREADWISRCGRSTQQCAAPRCMDAISLDAALASCRQLLGG